MCVCLYVCDRVRASVSVLLRSFLSYGFFPLNLHSFIHKWSWMWDESLQQVLREHCGHCQCIQSMARIHMISRWQGLFSIAVCAAVCVLGHAMKAQKTATKTQMYLQQKRKCRINKTATCNSKSATSSVSVIDRKKALSKNIKAQMLCRLHPKATAITVRKTPTTSK